MDLSMATCHVISLCFGWSKSYPIGTRIVHDQYVHEISELDTSTLWRDAYEHSQEPKTRGKRTSSEAGKDRIQITTWSVRVGDRKMTVTETRCIDEIHSHANGGGLACGGKGSYHSSSWSLEQEKESSAWQKHLPEQRPTGFHGSRWTDHGSQTSQSSDQDVCDTGYSVDEAGRCLTSSLTVFDKSWEPSVVLLLAVHGGSPAEKLCELLICRRTKRSKAQCLTWNCQAQPAFVQLILLSSHGEFICAFWCGDGWTAWL